GSLGLDLEAAIDVIFLTTHPQKIPTGVKGPIVVGGQTVGALLIGRSSASMMGLFVLTGVIDADYTGEIIIMAYTPFPPVRVSKGQRLAQLVPLPQLTGGMQPMQADPREDRGFGSTRGLALLTLDLTTRPKVNVDLNYCGETCRLHGLLDTGADSCIIA
ncbi:hypothetical protein N311_11419, partial [Apaloderma vittatum]